MLNKCHDLLFTTLRNRVRKFSGDESGALIIFALMLFVLMVMMGGFAVDLMRYETRRVELQNTLDRSVLAAASLNQHLEPEGVVRDYFAKAQLDQYLTKVDVTEALNSRAVKAQGLVDTKPFFMHMLGIDKFDAKGVSAAEQRVTDIEISLVLDVSGSMQGAKIVALRAAAAEFVQTVLENDPYHRISISIVPYNAQVNLGSALRAKYNATNVHGVAGVNCLELAPAAFTAPGISRTTTIPMSAYADVTGSTNQSSSYVGWADTNYGRMNTNAPFCRKGAFNEVRLPNNNIAVLQAQINALQAEGNTSITLGMKWGLALLDPASQPMFAEFASENAIPSQFAVRPFSWTKTDSTKIVVLMTDGEHVAHNRINDTYKTGASPIYRSTGDGNYSIRFTTGRPSASGTREYWAPHLCVTNACRDGSNTAEAWLAGPWNSGSGVAMQQWQDVWANERLSWVAWQLYARALGTAANRSTVYNNTINTLSSSYASVAAMNATLQQSCTQAKNNRVTVYGIAFQAPANGQAQISQCATSVDHHYFNASEPEKIAFAFRTIAANITQLRLTQ